MSNDLLICKCKYCGREFHNNVEDDECILCWDKISRGEKLTLKAEREVHRQKKKIKKRSKYQIGSVEVFLRHKKRRINQTSYSHYYLGDYIPTRYEQDTFSKMIYPKFKNESESLCKPAAEEFARILINEIKEKNLKFDLMIPIPRSVAGRIARGHSILTSSVTKNIGKVNCTGTLERISTIRKSSFNSSDRPTLSEHLDSIKCTKNIFGKKILLFDDIYTTGNTAGACVLILLESGASEVSVITLGRTI